MGHPPAGTGWLGAVISDNLLINTRDAVIVVTDINNTYNIDINYKCN